MKRVATAGDAFYGKQQCLMLVILFCEVVARGSGFQIVNLYASPRDYEVTSALYPATYPSRENVTWRWNVSSGMWAVIFTEFKLTCDPMLQLADKLVISQGGTYSCTHRGPVPNYAYRINSPNFTIEFYSAGNRVPDAIVFRIMVLYGKTPEALDRKIDDRRIETYKKNKAAETNKHVPCLMYTIFLAVLVMTNIVMVVWVCLLQRRHRTLKTSHAVSIRQMRRETPEGCRAQDNSPSPEPRDETRLNTREPGAAAHTDNEVTCLKRQVRRNDSDASWIMRAQMSVHKATCSTSSSSSNNSINSSSRRLVARHRALSESGVRHQPASIVTLDSLEVSDDEGFEPSPPTSLRPCRLGTLPEERLSRKSSLPALRPSPDSRSPVRSVDNAGYFLMSDSRVKYTNASR